MLTSNDNKSYLTPESPATNCWWTHLSPRSNGYWSDENQKYLRQMRSEAPGRMFIEPQRITRCDTRTFQYHSRKNSHTSTENDWISADNDNLYMSKNYTVDTPSGGYTQRHSKRTNGLEYPTWSLLGRNSCPNLKQTEGIGRTVVELKAACNKRIHSYEKTRSHSQPPPSKNAKIAQRSSHTKIAHASRRCRSLGRTANIDATNHIRPRRTRGDDFRSLEDVGVSATAASYSADEKGACIDLFRQDTRAFGMQRTPRANIALRSPMEHPYFIWSLLMNDQSALSRLKLLKVLSMIQLKKHNCHGDCTLDYIDFTGFEIPEKQKENLTLLQGSHSIARVGKEYNEDAHYIPPHESNSHQVGDFFALADGVGEWARYGINSSVFSKAVIEEISHHLLNTPADLSSKLSPDGNPTKSVLLHSLVKGYQATQKPENPVFGACTIITGLVSDGHKLVVANLGDCSVIQLRRDVVRKMRMVIAKKSLTTQHSFNTPKQFVNCPGPEHYPMLLEKGLTKTVEEIKQIRLEAQKAGHEITSDDPLQASFTEFNLVEGDLLLCASDGLFDNLFDDEIAQLCSYAISPYEAKVMHAAWDQSARRSHLGRSLADEWLKGRLAHPNAMEPPSFVIDPTTNEKNYYTDPKNVATGLVEAAYARGLDPAANVPFGRAAKRAGFIDMAQGGKADDTTCIAMWVTAKQD